MQIGTRRVPFFSVVWLPLLSSCAATPAKPVEPPPQNAAPAAASASAAPAAPALLARARDAFGVLPAAPAEPPAQVALGRRLFFETRVSADEKVGCVTCHEPAKWGTDGLPRSRGVFGRENPRNAPTVFNAGLQTAAHWHADRDSVEDQARRALLGKGSFGLASDADAVQRMRALPAPYPDAFRQAFPNDADPVSVQNWGTAIGAYERTLITPGPFDAFLNGDESALGAPARAGLEAFLDEGCQRCHDGALIGGRSLQKFGKYTEYAPLTHSAAVDNGRFELTKSEDDRFVFKVPPLRNVARTAPYFHDGSVATLPEAVAVMAKTQLGKELPPERVAAVVSFLETLTAAVPPAFSPAP